MASSTTKVRAARLSFAKSRQYIHVPHTFGEEVADRVANGMGSWTFIIIQSAFVGGWILLNLTAVIKQWDPYPFILLNLLFSTQAAYAAPIIMMSQNRQAQKDHLRDDHEAEEVDLLYKINQQQLEILDLLRSQVCPAAALPSSLSLEAIRTPQPARNSRKPAQALPRRRRR